MNLSNKIVPFGQLLKLLWNKLSSLYSLLQFENQTKPMCLCVFSCIQFGDKVFEVYHRADFSGALAKQIFTARTSIPTHRQTAIPTPPYRASPQQQTCNPRLSLRFLANYYTLAKLVLLSLILWLFIGFGPTGILLTLVFLTVLYIFFSGVVYTVRQHSHTHEHIE